jgi:hypothetical protein
MSKKEVSQEFKNYAEIVSESNSRSIDHLIHALGMLSDLEDNLDLEADENLLSLHCCMTRISKALRGLKTVNDMPQYWGLK